MSLQFPQQGNRGNEQSRDVSLSFRQDCETASESYLRTLLRVEPGIKPATLQPMDKQAQHVQQNIFYFLTFQANSILLFLKIVILHSIESIASYIVLCSNNQLGQLFYLSVKGFLDIMG